jgi:hypothetical protein
VGQILNTGELYRRWNSDGTLRNTTLNNSGALNVASTLNLSDATIINTSQLDLSGRTISLELGSGVLQNTGQLSVGSANGSVAGNLHGTGEIR